MHQRLLNIARQEHRRFNDLLQHYALERWLFRLSRSAYGERFILKGALLLIAWQSPITRPTRDIDLLARIGNDLDLIRGVIAEISQTPVETTVLCSTRPASRPNGSLKTPIMRASVRSFVGHLGNARIAMQVDIGFSDVVTPAPVACYVSNDPRLNRPDHSWLTIGRARLPRSLRPWSSWVSSTAA